MTEDSSISEDATEDSRNEDQERTGVLNLTELPIDLTDEDKDLLAKLLQKLIAKASPEEAFNDFVVSAADALALEDDSPEQSKLLDKSATAAKVMVSSKDSALTALCHAGRMVVATLHAGFPDDTPAQTAQRWRGLVEENKVEYEVELAGHFDTDKVVADG